MDSSNPQPLLVRLMSEASEAQQRGDFDQAALRFRELTRRYPRFPDAWHYYGILLHQNREYDRGLQMMRKAESIEPDNLVFLLNLATVLREQHRLVESLEALDKAYKIAPRHGQILAQLVQIHLLVNRGGDLIDEIEARIRQEPGSWRLYMWLGECCEQGGERERAMQAFEKAAQIAPDADKSEAHLRRGWAARAAGESGIARQAIRDALNADPDSNHAYIGLATLASEKADFENATRFARKALELDQNSFAAWHILANAAPGRNQPEFLEELEAAVKAAGDDPRAWMLHFAHGQILERREQYDSAFAAYALGNSQHKSRQPYSAEEQDAYAEGIIAHLGEEFLARVSQVGLPTSRPIFICGMPRSGTTLVESIVAAHPQVQAGGEMRHIHDRLRRALRYDQFSRVGPWLANAETKTLQEIARDWDSVLKHTAAGHDRVTDKMPGNFSLLGLIHACLPQARIVHVNRDPRDTAFSCFATTFSDGLPFSWDLANTGHFYRSYRRLIAHWRKLLGPSRIIEIRYEELVKNPEITARYLLEALELSWDPRCLEFHASRRKISTASVYQVRQPIYTRSVGRWRHFEKHLGPLLEAIGDIDQ